ncbi:oxysterol-binding protein-related protein 11 isoform X2 [Procambarus clarkii]|uniref:oxysterol-binding protein-related protein 11 isoform X2 n=1 Tax=Procambarus clarkii TaxID=6728 RepID=UPI001E676CD9|nr:oxysterol-binding protein-related protein 11-like isoform X2 [Procambarus clarkii]
MEEGEMDEHLRQPYEGQLIKFTNVVKGWQARWFILNPEVGTLEYYLSESDKHERARGSIQLAGAVISPSDEDSYTFTVSPAAGESYKLRATDTRDRQMWLNRLRVVAEMHTRAIAHNHPPLAPREHRTPGSSNAGSTNQAASPPPMGLAVLDAFTQVAEVLEEARRQHSALVTAIEDMPSYGSGMRCTEPNLLLLKATSQATLLCLDQCLGVLRTQHMSAPHHQPSPPVTSVKVGSLGGRSSPRCSPLLGRSPRFHRRTASDASSAFLQRRRSSPTPTRLGSPSLRSTSPSLRARTAPHSPTPGTTQGVSGTLTSSLTGQPSMPLPCSLPADIQGTGNSRSSSVTSVTPISTPTPPPIQSRAGTSENESEISDEERPDGDGELGEVGDGQRSVIMHIISQLRLGMDLTRVTLPTFILERRSLLEMFADFLGHPDYFVRIGEANSPEERIQQVVKWYLTSIHVGRNGSVAKKPYNPIIGEVFHCSWRIPRISDSASESTETSDSKSAEGKKNSSYITIKFSAEQVSHHPPVSAFYFECPEKQLSINAHIWTKSKFMGMSVGVNLVGDITLIIGSVQESYSLAMPSAYARSILTEPWVELGGRVNISSPETGCQAVIVFHTKPFYGGKLHRVTAEVKNAVGTTLTRVQGEWDSVLEFAYADGTEEIINVNDIPMVCVKRLRPITQQAPNESRRLWLDVSVALARGDVETATSHKRALEEQQRKDERERASRNAEFPTQLFSSPFADHWVYNHLPAYAFTSCSSTTQIQ